MKIRVFPRADGASDVYLQRTRAAEGRSILLMGVKKEVFRATLEQAVKKMRKEPTDEI